MSDLGVAAAMGGAVLMLAVATFIWVRDGAHTIEEPEWAKTGNHRWTTLASKDEIARQYFEEEWIDLRSGEREWRPEYAYRGWYSAAIKARTVRTGEDGAVEVIDRRNLKPGRLEWPTVDEGEAA